jgi:pectinesterase
MRACDLLSASASTASSLRTETTNFSSIAFFFDASPGAKVNPASRLYSILSTPLFPNTLSPLPVFGLTCPPMIPRATFCLLSAISLTALGLLAPSTNAQDVHVRVSPDVKTGIEGTIEFPTIQMAMDHHPFAGVDPSGKPGRVFIHIAPGTYHERVIVTQNHPNITFIGMGKTPADVVITNSLNAKQAGGTFFTETVEVNGTGFEADNLTFENAAGNTGQAVAIAVRSDRAIFKHCRFLGHQDTLFADYGRQYYVDTYIEGGVDFIFGNAAAVFNHSEIHANAPGWLTAQSRTSADEPTGYVILNSRVTSSIEHALATANSSAGQARSAPRSPEREVTSLGRPWRPYSRVVYINTWLSADVTPQGWNTWGNTPGAPEAWYAEFNSSGPGANPAARIPWSHQLTAAEAAQFQPKVFLAGLDHWNPEAEAAKLP